jgi:hypothetical protein
MEIPMRALIRLLSNLRPVPGFTSRETLVSITITDSFRPRSIVI